MSKLYIFGIGGTGSRVIRSLTMLLASGVKLDDKIESIVPIIIDPDTNAADLTRTVDVIKKYNELRASLEFTSENKNRFFGTEIEETLQNFILPLNNTRDVSFKNYMSVDTMSDSNKAMMNILFSQNNLDSNMKVGFKGNPNIGSIVLNQFEESKEFKDFANNFKDGDKIFIISSIFGGTGASGFPLLAKTLRGSEDIPNHGLINKSQIGAISILPYFGVKKSDDSEIDSGTFISKTKAALNYYLENISNNNTVDMLYYIGDNIRGSYDNHEGGELQKNSAHLIELVSALAIVDFSKSSHKGNTIHKEFGLENDSNRVIYENFGYITRTYIHESITQFMLFCNYFKDVTKSELISQRWAKDGKIEASYINSQYIKTLNIFQENFRYWLNEMDDNGCDKRRLSIFELSNTKNAFEIVKGIKTKKVMSLASNYALFDDFLNEQKTKSINKEQYLIESFYLATKKLIQKKLNF